MIQFKNSDLERDIEKIENFDVPITVSKEFDINLNVPFAIDVEDGSYFYANKDERDSDFELLKSIVPKFSFVENMGNNKIQEAKKLLQDNAYQVANLWNIADDKELPYSLLDLANSLGWTCTDADNFQYGKKISEKVFIFKELNQRKFIGKEFSEEEIIEVFEKFSYWNEEEIDLNDYSEKEIQSNISAYYSDIKEIQEIYGQETDWIVAECIFEQESGLY